MEIKFILNILIKSKNKIYKRWEFHQNKTPLNVNKYINLLYL